MIIPPVKCQGIKTKITPLIRDLIDFSIEGCWVEPFCGSCVVALNVQPHRAILADTNQHLIALYQAIQRHDITPGIVKDFLRREGEELFRTGEAYYYEVRERFNTGNSPLDFMFLNRACFNGLIRFNRHGKFNVPFGHKPERFRPAYITKIVNQVRSFLEVIRDRDWTFVVADFKDTFASLNCNDFVYADPPYIGRHVDYFNSWSEKDEMDLTRLLKGFRGKFLLSTWHSNKYRVNPIVEKYWGEPRFHLRTREHFYHVGSTEDLRNEVYEALISNYELRPEQEKIIPPIQEQLALFGE